MMEKKVIKILKEYQADELGLPLRIFNVPIIELDGYEVVDLDYDKIAQELFAALILKPYSLNGAEIRFMRLFMGLTLEGLAEILHVTHPTVLAWEKQQLSSAKITDSTEEMFRIYAAKEGVDDSELVEVLLNQYFKGAKRKKVSPNATIIKFDPNQESSLEVIFPDEEEEFQEA